MFGKKKDSRRELREVFRATEEIQDAENPRDADMATGYVIGIIDEKVRDGRLSIATAEALGKMVEAVGENIYRQLSRGSDRGSIAKIYSIEDPEGNEDPGTGV